ncbi:hypothetical protein L1887_59073 [Cichorium endivia]|nr:hypothetical protein L1887_59073 [Cichorium endivia]
MSATPFDLRMPRLEGHLVLNTATLSDSPQTSDRTAWSEKWCSLEDGCLLVYHDRTAAIVMPDEPICTIDLRSFAHALARAGATGPRLRTSTSAWDLAAVKGGRAEASPVARAESLEEVQDENVQSLPAPPRASKRRALVSTGAAASPRPRPAPLGDRTNALQVAGLPDVGELCIDDRRPAARGRRAQGAATA